MRQDPTSIEEWPEPASVQGERLRSAVARIERAIRRRYSPTELRERQGELGKILRSAEKDLRTLRRAVVEDHNAKAYFYASLRPLRQTLKQKQIRREAVREAAAGLQRALQALEGPETLELEHRFAANCRKEALEGIPIYRFQNYLGSLALVARKKRGRKRSFDDIRAALPLIAGIWTKHTGFGIKGEPGQDKEFTHAPFRGFALAFFDSLKDLAGLADAAIDTAIRSFLYPRRPRRVKVE